MSEILIQKLLTLKVWLCISYPGAVVIRQKEFTGTKGLCLHSQHQKGSVQPSWEVPAIGTRHPVLTSASI